MKELPQIFNGDEVRAVLDGRKTQHRVPMKPQPTSDNRNPGGTKNMPDGWVRWQSNPDGVYPASPSCPHGQVGDRLWVREKWRFYAWHFDDGVAGIEYSDGQRRASDLPDSVTEEQAERWWIQCSDDCKSAGAELAADGNYWLEDMALPTRWRSPVTMPKWASRLTLEITEVRVQRDTNCWVWARTFKRVEVDHD